jgi:adenylate cyclase
MRDSNAVDAYANLGFRYSELGQYEKTIELGDKAIRLSPYDPAVFYWYWLKGIAYLALQQDDQAIEWARWSIAINQNFGPPYRILAAALAFTGHEAEAQ